MEKRLISFRKYFLSSWYLKMACAFTINLFEREILLLKVIPTVESFELKKSVNDLIFIRIFYNVISSFEK